MSCNPTRLELSNTDATTVQITVTPNPGDGTTVYLEVPGLSINTSGVTSGGVVSDVFAPRSQDTNSLWDGTIQVATNAPADIVVQVVETASSQVVGVTVSDAAVSYCAPISGAVTEAPNDGQQYGRQNESWTVIAGSENPDYVYGNRQILADLLDTNAKVTMIGDSIMNDTNTTFTTLYHAAAYSWRPDKWGGIWHNIAGAMGPANAQAGAVNPGISIPGDGTAWLPGLANATGGYGRYGESAGTTSRMFDIGFSSDNLSTDAADHNSGISAKFGNGYGCFINANGSRDVATSANQAVLKYAFNIGNDTDYVDEVNINLYNPGSTQNTGFQTTAFTGSGRRLEVVSATLTDTNDYDGSEGGVWQGQIRSLNNTEYLAVEKQFFGGTDNGFTLGYIGNGGWRTRNHFAPGESITTGDGTQAYHYDATYLEDRLGIEATTHAVIFLGQNDVTGASRGASTVLADLQTVISNTKTARPGVKIVVFTLYPVSGDDATKLQTKIDLNTSIRAIPNSDSDVVVYDLAAFIDDSHASNAAFFSAWLADGTHPNTTGALAMMEDFWAKVVAAGSRVVQTVNGNSGPDVLLSDSYLMLIETPADGDYTIDGRAATARTITNLYAKTDSGTCTLTLKTLTDATTIGSVSVTDAGGSASSLSNTAVGENDRLGITIASNSSSDLLELVVEYTG